MNLMKPSLVLYHLCPHSQLKSDLCDLYYKNCDEINKSLGAVSDFSPGRLNPPVHHWLVIVIENTYMYEGIHRGRNRRSKPNWPCVTEDVVSYVSLHVQLDKDKFLLRIIKNNYGSEHLD